MMADIVRGRYRHFKGGVYIVLGTATHSETGEELVIYHKAASGLFVSDEERKLWARPAKMWNETVFRHGSEKQRFELLNTIPAADVAPVRHGRWIEQPLDFDLCGVAYYQCSECGKEQQTPSNYCQFCGARMEVWKWCVWQDEDNEGVYCTAHIHEDRVLNCPYKNLGERQRADYPCQDYRPMNGGQDE